MKGKSISSREVSSSVSTSTNTTHTTPLMSTTATVHPLLREDRRDFESSRPASAEDNNSQSDSLKSKGKSTLSICISGKVNPGKPSQKSVKSSKSTTPDSKTFRSSKLSGTPSPRDEQPSVASSESSTIFEFCKSRPQTPSNERYIPVSTNLREAREQFILGAPSSEQMSSQLRNLSSNCQTSQRKTATPASLFLSVPTTTVSPASHPMTSSKLPTPEITFGVNDHFTVNSSNAGIQSSQGYRYAGVERLMNRSSIYDPLYNPVVSPDSQDSKLTVSHTG